MKFILVGQSQKVKLGSVVVKLWSRAAVLTYFLWLTPRCGFLELKTEFCHCLVLKNKRLGKHNLPVWGNMVWNDLLLLLIPSAGKPKQGGNISRKSLCQ